MKPKELQDCRKEDLLEIINELHLKLKQKNATIHQTRERLRVAKRRISKMKDTVVYQRNRILELMP